jgi:DNA polymerase-1
VVRQGHRWVGARCLWDRLNRFVGSPSWYRSLIKPPPGYGLAYIDYSQQEFGIGAALSGDRAMQDAYQSGDPYMAFAKQAGLAPPEATKATHKAERERAKACILGTQYGMGDKSLARRIGCSVLEAGELLRMHRQTYKTFWGWSDGAVDYAMLRNRIHTTFGWPLHVGANPNPRSLANFPMQANGADMLRVAVILATEACIQVCAPVHDALLIIAPLEQLEEHVALMQKIMAKASRIVLGGFELRTDAEVVRYPDRYRDPRGDVMWKKVMTLIEEVEAQKPLIGEIPAARQVLTSSASSSLILSN